MLLKKTPEKKTPEKKTNLIKKQHVQTTFFHFIQWQ